MPVNANPTLAKKAVARSNLLFVPHNGLKDRNNKTAKLESQKYATAARKHIMRGEDGACPTAALLSGS